MISLIIPFYNEAANVPALFTRIEALFAGRGEEYEVICIDDGSGDDTFERLLERRRANPRVKLLRLSRNFGKEKAVTAGLRHVRGEAAVILDADLQHPPELIPTLIEQWRNGYQMVYAVRHHQGREGIVRTLAARLYYWAFAHIADLALPRGAGDFRLLDRRVVDALNNLPERTRFMKGLFAWVGYRQIGVPFTPPPRLAGTSGWSLRQLARFALDGVTAFSTVPLRVWSLIGLAVAALSLLYGGSLAGGALLHGTAVPGYSVLTAVVLFLGGVQLIGIGVLGEYLGRVFDEVKQRPLYLVSESYGFEQSVAVLPPPRRRVGAM